MRKTDLISCLEKIAPVHWQEDWDKSGVQILSDNSNYNSVLLALDIDRRTINVAKRLEVDLIITHHPLFFHKPASLDFRNTLENKYIELLKSNIDVYSMHTNLDIAPWGVNYALAKAFDITPPIPSRPLVPTSVFLSPADVENVFAGSELFEGSELGLGSIVEGDFAALDIINKANFIANNQVQHNVTHETKINRIVFSGGSWDGEWLEQVVSQGVDLVITGEMKYHDFLDLEDYGIASIVLGHRASESLVLSELKSILENTLAFSEELKKLKIHVFENKLDTI